MRRQRIVAAMAGIVLAAGPSVAQVRTVDPNQAIDADLGANTRSAPSPRPAATADRYADPAARGEPVTGEPATGEPVEAEPVQAVSEAGAGPDAPGPAPARDYRGAAAADRRQQRADRTQAADDTFHRDDLIGAGEGVFGKGAQGFAGLIEKILKDQGEPNAYIAGREASGAIVVGLRYGSGIMTHKVEGQMPVYWTGPSVGFDLGGDANKVFVLVYNLYDTAELYHRFPQAEGHLYAVGGFSASYLRWGHVVVIPVRLGVGWRAGVNVGYMKFTRKSKWLPF